MSVLYNEFCQLRSSSGAREDLIYWWLEFLLENLLCVLSPKKVCQINRNTRTYMSQHTKGVFTCRCNCSWTLNTIFGYISLIRMCVILSQSMFHLKDLNDNLFGFAVCKLAVGISSPVHAMHKTGRLTFSWYDIVLQITLLSTRGDCSSEKRPSSLSADWIYQVQKSHSIFFSNLGQGLQRRF